MLQLKSKTPCPAEIELLSSEELALHARSGYEDCFAELLKRHGEPLRGFLRRRGASPQDAEDIGQAAFSKAFERLRQYDPRYKFSTWLFTIAKNMAARALAKAGRHEEPLENAEEPLDSETPSEILEKAEERDNLWLLAAKSLPQAQAEVLWLMYAKGLSVAEIAGRTGKSGIHVRVLLHRARTKLGAALKGGASSKRQEV